MKKNKRNAEGTVLMAGTSRIWTFANSKLLRKYEVDLLGPAFFFFLTIIHDKLRASRVRPQ